MTALCQPKSGQAIPFVLMYAKPPILDEASAAGLMPTLKAHQASARYAWRHSVIPSLPTQQFVDLRRTTTVVHGILATSSNIRKPVGSDHERVRSCAHQPIFPNLFCAGCALAMSLAKEPNCEACLEAELILKNARAICCFSAERSITTDNGLNTASNNASAHLDACPRRLFSKFRIRFRPGAIVKEFKPDVMYLNHH